MGLTVYFVLSSGIGFLAPVGREMRQHLRKLSASTEAPGPHDFAVRHSPFVHVQRTLRAMRSIAFRAQRS